MAGPAPPASASQDELNGILRDALPRQGAWSDEEYRGSRDAEPPPARIHRRLRSDPRCQDRYWLGADLVVEVVSPDRPERDLVDKRIDYAVRQAGIPEYWVVDPRDHGWLRRARRVRPWRRGRLASAPRIRGRRGGIYARQRHSDVEPLAGGNVVRGNADCPTRSPGAQLELVIAVFQRSNAWISRAFSVSRHELRPPRADGWGGTCRRWIVSWT